MTIAQLIAKLEEVRAQHGGDVPVGWFNADAFDDEGEVHFADVDLVVELGLIGEPYVYVF